MVPVKYVVITPARDEASHLAGTIQCMAAQSVRPAEWIIVDDGSRDRTAAIADHAADTHRWIKVVHRVDRGFRQPGGGVIQAFDEGLAAVTEPEWQFVVKFDGDLSFGPNYFAECLARFESEPELGIGGGTICSLVNGTPETESKIDPMFHVRGATKIYRRQCWDQIGGLAAAAGWDALDEIKANMLGWTTRTFADIQLVHHRPAGAADGTWQNWVKGGRANYLVGYHPLFMLGKCARRTLEKPYLVAALGLLTGFAGGYTRRLPRIAEKPVIDYLRRQQIDRLLGRQSLWTSPHHSVSRCEPGTAARTPGNTAV